MAEEKGGLYRLFDVLAKIVAIVVLLSMGYHNIVALLNAWGVAIPENVASMINTAIPIITEWGVLVLAGLVTLEFGFKHNLVTIIIALVVLALVILPRFFPDIFEQLQNIGQ